jgi:hypothetical protein
MLQESCENMNALEMVQVLPQAKSFKHRIKRYHCPIQPSRLFINGYLTQQVVGMWLFAYGQAGQR